MKRSFGSFVVCLLSFCGFAQKVPGEMDLSQVPVTSPHYQEEYNFDKPVDPGAWKKQKPGLQASFGSTDDLYLRSEVPSLNQTTMLEETVWRGERLNAVIVTWSDDSVNQVRFSLSDFTDPKGNVLDKNLFKFSLVKYVLSNYPYGAVNTTCALSPYEEHAFVMPDRLAPLERFDIPGQSVRSIWLSADIPAETERGIYTGSIEVASEKQRETLTLKVTVQDHILPKPAEWKHRLDLWQNPWVIARHYQVDPWSDEHKTLLRRHLQLYADAGGKYITTYAVHSPWSDNSYMIEGTMIDWIKQKNGSWKFEYRIFDEYVSLAMESGIDKAITIYTPVPWGNRFRYLDETSGNYMYEEWAPDSEPFKKFWNIFLDDLKIHLQQKGWFERTYLGINENTLDQTLAAIKVINDHSDQWKITYAGNWHKELDLLLDDYSFLYGGESGIAELQARSLRGSTTTYYVCCNPAKPNNFVFSPPVEGRWISWYTAARGYDGFLRWAYDAWPADPSRDARHILWPAGDCFLVYPGANSSIRYEKLREGIVDFEKIHILKKLAEKSTDKNVKKLWVGFEQHLKVFTTEKEFKEDKITADVHKGKSMLKELSEILR